MSAASSSLISIATSSNSGSSICNSKTLYLQSPIISISKTCFKTPKFSFNFKTHYLNFYPLLRSSFPSPNSSPSYEVIQVDENPESEPSAIEEELENDDEEEEEEETEESQYLHIGNLPCAITSSVLSQIFGEAGNVVSAETIYNRVTRRSKGFGYITMASVQEAQEAIRMFNGCQIGGRTVKVNFAKVLRVIQRERSSNREFIESRHMILVGNLNWIITSEKLKEAFADQPGLLSTKVMYGKDSGKSQGFGFVSFSSPEAKASALSAMNGVQIGGRTVKVCFARVPGAIKREKRHNREFIDSPHTIFVGNLKWTITSEKLKEAFANQPGLLSVRVMYEKHSGRSRGFGFVSFSSPEAEASALSAMNGVKVEGRPLRLNLAL